MQKYRIYALIYGETLQEGKIFECEIRKMDFDEQKKRKFSPIQSIFSKNELTTFHKTYATSLSYVDSIKIKSEYVIIHDIEEQKPNSALGGAIRAFDRIARYLSLADLEDIKRIHGRKRGSFQPYLYQVNKIYRIDKLGKESNVKLRLESGHMYLPDRPGQTKWRDSGTKKFLDELYNFHDSTVERALKYLYRSSIGFFVLDSPEKIALDHFKSIEIIVNALGIKKVEGKRATFKQKLEDVAKKLGIESDDKKRIEDFWDERSRYGDIAHPSPFDEVERYPNQFPIPSSAHYTGGGFFDSIAANILIKYYYYVKNVYYIEIENAAELDAREGTFSKVYEISLWGTTYTNKLIYFTLEKNNSKLISNIKRDFANEYTIEESSIVEFKILPNTRSFHQKTVIIRVKNELEP